MSKSGEQIGKSVHYYFRAPADAKDGPFRGPRAAIITAINADSSVALTWFAGPYTNWEPNVFYNKPTYSKGGGVHFWQNVGEYFENRMLNEVL